MIPIQVPWTIQPPRGARPKVDFIMDPRGYGSTSGGVLSSGTAPIIVDTTPTVLPTLITTPYGAGLNFSGTAGQSTQLLSSFKRLSDPFDAITCGLWLLCSNIGDDNIICGQWTSSAGFSGWRVELDIAGATLLPRIFTASADDTKESLDSTVDVISGWHHVVFVMYLGASNFVEREIYVDGQLDTTNTATSTGWNTSQRAGGTDSFEIAESGGGDQEPYNGEMVGLFIDRKRWSAQRIARAYENHWNELYYPQTKWIPSSVAAGTPVVITDVNTTEIWNDGATGLVITGTGFRGA